MAVAGRASEPAVVAHSRHGRLPAARGLVPRRPLFDRLSRVGPGEVVLLCAPAGSGKTALLRSWVESEGLADRVAWVSVERAERDAQRSWLSVVDELSGTRTVLVAVGGIVLAAFGVVMFVEPGDGAIALLALVAAFALVRGTFDIALAVELRRVAGELKERFRSPLRAKPVPHG
jgi:hypothetical protein